MKQLNFSKLPYETLEVGVIEVAIESGYAISFPELPPFTNNFF